MANVGSLDRAARFALGAVLVGLGVVMLGTAAFRFCPAYALLGIHTCPVSKA